MSLPAHARVVIIGCGIVGNSVAYHLGRLGWRDIVLLDKGPLPNPGGSTGHASNFIYLVDHSKEMTALTAESVRQYQELGVSTQAGGMEVAREPERMQELTRRMASAKSWGIEPVALVTPAEVKRLVPYIDEKIILGGFYTPGVGVVDSLRAGTLMREKGIDSGALQVAANTEVTGIDVKDGRVHCVRTTAGDIEVENVVVCCGVWSPRVALMAGAHIPLTPAVHQMIDVGPVPRFAGARSDIEHPIVRDMDTNMYERQAGGDLEIGSYAHRPILYNPEDLPSVKQAALSPTEFPFTQADFAPQMEHALELMPEIVGDEKVGVKYAINGILSLTPDGMPVLGESSDVAGLWSASAVWVKEGPGTCKTLAEWMVHGESEIDVHASDAARFHEHQKTRHHVRARAAEGFNKTYGIVHPAEQWASNRNVRLAPFHQRERELQAFFFEAAGWERPFWYEANASLLDEFGDRITRRTAEWESRWWSPIINAEHLAMRERAGIFDLSAFTIFDITGPGALTAVQGVALRQMDVPVVASRISYVGDLGWEVYVPMEQGLLLWDTLWEAGRPHGLAACGIGVYGTTGRLEKCYRAHGNELETEYNVVEAGMTAPRVKAEDFVGKEAHLRHREEGPAAILCTLTVDDHTSKGGEKRYMLGREPIVARDGQRIVDRRGRGSYVTSAGAGPSVGKHILMAYLTPEEAGPGKQLLGGYMGKP